MVEAREESLERIRDEIDAELQGKIVVLQKKIKKLKVTDNRQELTVDLIKKLCFVRPVQPRASQQDQAEEEETKSETTAATTTVEPSHDELVALKAMRLGFQNIGPTIQNLEMFTQLETLILSGNAIEEIPAGALSQNTKLQFLSLSRNKLTQVKHLNHLKSLQFLDISNNKIDEVDNLREFPPNLLALKLIGNPIEERASATKELAAYRKPIVLHLKWLEDLDKIEVDPAERMSYMGVLPKRINVDSMLQAKVKNEMIRKQGFKLQNELKLEIKRDQGKGNVEIVSESLNEFAKMDEMDNWMENLSEMMTRQEERSAQANIEKQKRQERISKEVEKATLKYGRVMTPKTNLRNAASGSKRAGILDVDR